MSPALDKIVANVWQRRGGRSVAGSVGTDQHGACGVREEARNVGATGSLPAGEHGPEAAA
ncbi:MAG: hypothetical protein OHK0015_00940 [Chloroflexi bacterium OHK40]